MKELQRNQGNINNRNREDRVTEPPPPPFVNVKGEMGINPKTN